MNIDLDKIKPSSIAMVFLTFFVTVVPGALFFFLYKPELFLVLDSFKLVLLSMGITLPFFISNAILYVIWEGGLGESTESNGFQIGVLAGSVFTIPVVYIPLFLKLLVAMEGKTALFLMIGLELIVFFGAIIIESRSSKKVKTR